MTIWYNFWEAHSPEIWVGKQRQNLARFWTTFVFDREYLHNGKWKSKLSTTTPPLLDEKDLVKFGPVTKKVPLSYSNPPKINSVHDF